MKFTFKFDRDAVEKAALMAVLIGAAAALGSLKEAIPGLISDPIMAGVATAIAGTLLAAISRKEAAEATPTSGPSTPTN